MKSALFAIFVVSLLGLGGLWLFDRARRLKQERETRSMERAYQFGLPLPGQEAIRETSPADGAASPPRPTIKTAVSIQPQHRTPMPPAVAPALQMPAVAPHRAGLPSFAPPSARRLRKLKRSRYARTAIAYFEIVGFRVQQFDRSEHDQAPIDALLYMGESAAPAMAVRWSRAEGAPSGVDEVRAFSDACVALRIQRATFIAQYGFESEAQIYAGERGLNLLDADGVAAKLAALDPVHYARLDAVTRGAR